jgi:hypothetical protein
MASIPSIIRLYGTDWSVEEKTAGELFEIQGCSLLGLEVFEDSTLYVKDTLPPQLKAAVLLHEIVHGIDEFNNLNLSEVQVRSFSSGLFALLRENRQLVDYILNPQQSEEPTHGDV